MFLSHAARTSSQIAINNSRLNIARVARCSTERCHCAFGTRTRDTVRTIDGTIVRDTVAAFTLLTQDKDESSESP